MISTSDSDSDRQRLLELLPRLARLREMYLPERRYTNLVSLIEGFDLGSGGRCLGGFQDWVANKLLGHPSGLHWCYIIASRKLPALLEGGASMASLSAEQDEAVAMDLLRILEAFLKERVVVQARPEHS